MLKRAIPFLGVFLLPGIGFWILGERFIAANGPTFDEPVHLAAAHSYWATGDFRLNIEDPPIPKWLWALPGQFDPTIAFRPDPELWERNDQWRIGNDFLFREPGRVERLLIPARRMNLLFGLGIVLLVGWFARRVWQGWLPGALAAWLAAADPTLVAIAGILSSDAALAFFSLLAVYCAWEYLGQPRVRWLVALGVSLGLLLGSKFSAVMLLPGLVAGLFGFLLLGGTLELQATSLRERFASVLTPAVRIVIVALLTIAAGYSFVRFPDWGVGFKQQLVRAQVGDPHFFFLGQVRTTGSPGYFLVALLLKLPLGTILLVILATVMSLVARPNFRSMRWPVLVLPALGFFILITLSGVNLGIRVALPVMPFLWLLAARGVGCASHGSLRVIVALFALISTVAAGWQSRPYSLSYFNELTDGPETAIKRLGDSNMDWGQGLPALKQWMDREKVTAIWFAPYGPVPPGSFGIRYRALPGYANIDPPPQGVEIPKRVIVAVSASNLQGIYLTPPNPYAFLLQRRPVAIVGGCIWVFDLTEDATGREELDRIANKE
jgi:4-amino-4-deoxy-L-arabinose transferase-like glycosyltransferase